MKILCKKCKREIEISPFESKDPEKCYRCEFCRVAFTVRPKIGTEGYDIVFKDERFVLRSCVNCGKEFYEDPHEAIPVCPRCKTEPSVKIKPGPNDYFIVKEQGKKAGPYGLEQLGDWIREGLLKENDAVLTPEDTALKVFQVPELSKYLKDYSKLRKKEPTLTRSFYKRRVRVLPIVIGSFIILLAVWAYMVFQKRPETLGKTSVELLYRAWENVYPSLPESFDLYYQRGLEEYKRFTERSCGDAEKYFIKAFLKSREPYLLCNASLALSCLSEFEEDGSLTLAYELSKYAYGACKKPVCELSLARSLVRLGKIDEARDHLKAAFKVKPDDPSLLWAFGEILLRDRASEAKGIEMLLTSLKADPDLSGPHQVLAEHYLANERFKDALFHFEERVKKAKEDYRALIGRASLYVMLKRYNNAISDLEEASKLKSPGEERVSLAKLLYKIQGKTTEAKRNIGLAIGNLSKQSLVDSHTILSNIYLEDGSLDEARVEIEKGLALKPTDDLLLVNQIREALGKRKVEAEQLIQGILLEDRDLEDDAILDLIDRLSKSSVKEAELELLQKYAQKPRRFYPFLRLATIYIQRSEIQTAKKVLIDGMGKTVFYANSDFLPDLNAPRQEADIGRIEKEFKAASSGKMNPELISTAISLSKLQRIKEQLTGANTLSIRKDIEGIARRDPNIKQAYMITGFIYLKIGNATKAIESLKKASDMDINDPSTNLLLAMAYAMKKDALKANERLKGYKDDNWDFMVLALKADMEGIKDRENATEMYRQAYSKEKRFYPVILKLFESGR